MNLLLKAPRCCSLPVLIAGGGLLLLQVSCQKVEPPKPVQPPAKPPLFEWRDNGSKEPLSVRISLDRQIAVFERDGQQVGWCYVASGAGKYATKEGSYKVLEKKVDKVSSQYGKIVDAEGEVKNSDATPETPLEEGQKYIPSPMPYWMRLTWSGVGMHGGPIPKPGRPASHGCIRMPFKFVPNLFTHVKVGTPVTIVKDFPSEELAMGPMKPQANP